MKVQDGETHSAPIPGDFRLRIHYVSKPTRLQHGVSDHILKLSDVPQGWAQFHAMRVEKQCCHRTPSSLRIKVKFSMPPVSRHAILQTTIFCEVFFNFLLPNR